MVRLKGPSIALDAAGSIGGALVFSNWKGRSYAKKLSKPANPKSGGQVGGRAMLRFLSTNFSSLSEANIATWSDLARANNVSEYNAWMSYNLQRWGRFLKPTLAFPATQASEPMEIQDATATPLNRSMSIWMEFSEEYFNWGYTLFRSTSTGFDPAITNCIRVGLWDMTMPTTLTWIDGPLDPGTYYYRVDTFSISGRVDSVFTDEWSGTIT